MSCELLHRLPKLSRAASTAACAILAPLVLVELVRLTLLLPSLSAIAAAEATPSNLQAPQILPFERPVDAQKIAAAHLFGDANGQQAVKQSEPPPSSAPLFLTGILAGRNPKRGSAIVRVEERSERYVVGSTVGGASIEGIYADHVVIKRDGRLEALYLPRWNHQSGTDGGTKRAAVHPNSGSAVSVGQQGGISNVIRVAGAVNDATGQMRGFRVYPGADRRTFSGSGLHNGDVVIAVNGLPVSEQNRTSASNPLALLANGNHATLSVERFGQVTELTVDANQAGSVISP